MGDFVNLYEERRWTELQNTCQQMLDEGKEEFTVYAYMTAALAAKNSLANQTLEPAMEMFKKAAALSTVDSQEKVLFELFVKEVSESLTHADETFAGVAMTADTVQAYRNCMRLGADALLLAGEFGKEAALDAVENVWKQAASCMVKLCAVYRFEQDLGKVKVKKISNAEDDIRKTYVAKYDALTEQIRAFDASYVPEEIQRERLDAEHPEKKPEETDADGKPKKKGLIDRLLDFF